MSMIFLSKIEKNDELIDTAFKGKLMAADVVTDKAKALEWPAKKELSDYIETHRENNWN